MAQPPPRTRRPRNATAGYLSRQDRRRGTRRGAPSRAAVERAWDRAFQERAPTSDRGMVAKVSSQYGGLLGQGESARELAGQVARGDRDRLNELFDQIRDIESGKEEESGGLFDFIKDVPVLGRGANVVEDVLQTGPVQQILRTVDIPRAAVVAGMSELGETDIPLVGGNAPDDEDWLDKFNRRIGFGEVIEEGAFGDENEWVKRGLGFAGDVAFDPLTYTGAGLVAKGAAAPGRGAIGVGGAVGRKQLATEVLERAAREGLEGDALTAARALAVEAGQRGQGAFTRRGLARAGVDPDLARVLETPEFGLTGRIGRRRGTLPGSRIPAEAVADVKGAVKSRFGRELSADQLAARASRRRGAAEGALAVDRHSRWLKRQGRRGGSLFRFHRLDAPKMATVLDDIEHGRAATGPAATFKEFWDGIYTDLKGIGVDVDYRSGYVPHRYSVAGLKWAEDPDALRRSGIADSNWFRESFEKPRSVTADTYLWGERVGDPTIKRINELSMKHEGIELLETDLGKLAERTLKEAGKAVERKARAQEATRLGFAAPLDEVVEESAEQVRLGEVARKARSEEAAKTAKAASERSALVMKARNVAADLRRGLSGERSQLEAAIAKGAQDVERLAVRRDALQVSVDAAEKALAEQRRIAGVARRVERRRALASIRRLEDEVAARQQALRQVQDRYESTLVNLSAAEDIYDDALGTTEQMAREQAEHAGRELRQAEERLAAAREAVPSGRVESEGVEAAARDLDMAVRELNLLDEEVRAERLAVAQGEDLLREVEARIKIVDDVLKPGAGVSKQWVGGPGEGRYLGERARVIREALRFDDAATRQIAELEARAVSAQLDAAQAGVKVTDSLHALNDPKVAGVVRSEVRKGMELIAPGVQSDPTFARAFQNMVSIFDDPRKTNIMVEAYDTFNHWFKTWAVTTPGFIIRNGMGAWLNNYIHGVRFQDYVDFRKAFSLYKRNPRDFKVAAANSAIAEELQDAVLAISGTGWGQSAQEATRSLFRRSARGRTTERMFGKGMRPIPVIGSDTAVSRGMRAVNDEVEAMFRGALAWSHVRQGGSLQDALASVEKVHFNYRDISTFDEWAKRVMPFWTFMSRNIPLQIDILTRKPAYLNRTWGNLQRNLSEGEEQDRVVPEYFEDMGAINLGDGRYLNLDLPFLELNETADRVVNPLGFLADVQPLPRAALELEQGETIFSGAPLNSEMAPAPIWGELFEPLGLAEDGKMRRDVRYAIESLVPLLGRASRLAPEARSSAPDAGAEAKQRQIAALFSTLTGVGVRENTPNVQRGELFRRQQLMEELIDQLESRVRK